MNTHSNADSQTVTLRVPGDLISTRAEGLRAEFAPILQTAAGDRPPWNLVRLDLTCAQMVDSVGLNLIVALLKAVQRAGGRLAIHYTNPNVRRTLVFTRLDQHVELIQGAP